MDLGSRMEASLRAAFDPLHLELANESHNHSVPAGSQTHWNLIIVSGAFEGQRLIARQRAVYGALQAEMAAGIHALTMKTLTPAEWRDAGGDVANPAPPCHGGSKRG